MSTVEQPTHSVLEDSSEQLFRQVHPSMADGQLSSEAFVPSAKDQDLLSTLREHVGPQEAYRRWTDQGLKSIGTFAITVGEVCDQQLRALDDEAATEPDHASVDFTLAPSKGQKNESVGNCGIARLPVAASIPNLPTPKYPPPAANPPRRPGPVAQHGWANSQRGWGRGGNP